MMPPAHVILYDRDCGFCKWSLDKLLLWDRARRLHPVAIQSDEGERLLAGLSPAERLDSWHLVRPDGTVISAGAAAEPLARPAPRRAAARVSLQDVPARDRGAPTAGSPITAARSEAPSHSPRVRAEAAEPVKTRVGACCALLVAVALPGCATGEGSGAGAGDTLTVYVSGPLRGPSAPYGRAIRDGARLALEDADGRAGR